MTLAVAVDCLRGIEDNGTFCPACHFDRREKSSTTYKSALQGEEDFSHRSKLQAVMGDAKKYFQKTNFYD
ncbi:hypothetical protein [Mucilaginibacter sp.]